MDTKGRHQSVRHVAQFFEFDHLPAGLMRDTSRRFADLATALLADPLDGPELVVALRKLMEAKDCAVRAAMLTEKAED